MTYDEQVRITILDKALIGGLILFSTYLLNGSIEAIKSSLTISAEFAKQRINKLAELWSSLHGFEAILKQIIFDIGNSGQPSGGMFDSHRERILSLGATTAPALSEAIQRSRFWIGRDMVIRFENNLGILEKVLWHLDREEIEIAEREMQISQDELRLNEDYVFEFIDRPWPKRTILHKAAALLPLSRHGGGK